MSQPWKISIDNLSLGGFSPVGIKGSSPATSYGASNQANDMNTVDMTAPDLLTQGPGLADLTNGTQAAAVTTLLKGILDEAVTADVSYGIGGNILYKFSSTAVIDDATWPVTINKAAVTGEDGEDVAHYKGALYYSYNHSGSAGDIGRFDLSATFDDDWGSTVPTGAAALQNAPHQMIVGGNDILYFANGVYVGSYDGTTFEDQALDLPTGSVIQSIAWFSDRLWIAANHSSLTGENRVKSSIYVWDGTSDSWETEIPIIGRVGALHSRNGNLFVWRVDLTLSTSCVLSLISGVSLTDLAYSTNSSPPAYYQVTSYLGFLLWVDGDSLYAWGSGVQGLPNRYFHFADGGHSTVGGIAAPFGNVMVASNITTSYRLAQFSGYDVNAEWQSLLFDISGQGRSSRIETVRINIAKMSSGARVDWSLKNSADQNIHSDTISFAKHGGSVTTLWYNLNGKVAPDFYFSLDWENGSATNPVRIRDIKIYGTTE